MTRQINQLTFGVEFEVIVPRSLGTFDQIAAQLRVATGLSVEVRGVSRASWKIVHDGSVGGQGTAAEFVSPILKGQAGFDLVKTFAAGLVSIGATANHTCGFHVHVGGFQPELTFFKSLVKLYARYEAAIDQIMPASRRENRATYCRTVARATAAQIDQETSLIGIISVATGGIRYSKLNLQAYNKHRTVEFRHHSGTTDGTKALNWVKTCLRMVVAAQAGKTGTEVRNAPVSFASLPTKARTVAEMVSRPEGATREEIIAGTDWAALSVNRQARLAGLEIRVVRERGKDRFFATVGTTVLCAADLAGLAALIESEQEEIAFLNERAATFANAT